MNIFAYLGLVLLFVLPRVFPHMPNFTPAIAYTLFLGAVIKDRRIAYSLPLLAMFVSDTLLEILTRMELTQSWLAHGYGYHKGMLVIYPLIFVITLIGTWLQRRRTIANVLGAAFFSSCLFFLVSNFAVWVMDGMYSHNWEGLVECYTMAIPFFQYSLLADVGYSAILFGLYYLVVDYRKESTNEALYTR